MERGANIIDNLRELLAASNPGLVMKEDLARLEERLDELEELLDELEEAVEERLGRDD